VDRDDDYYDFTTAITSQAEFPGIVAANSGVLMREAEMGQAVNDWWEANVKFIVALPTTEGLMVVRATLLESFVKAITPVGLLDRFQVAGIIATWWGDLQFDLRALVAGGFGAVIDGWVTTITTALEEGSARDNPTGHRLVRALLPEHLAEIEVAQLRQANLEAAIKSGTPSAEDIGDEAIDEDEDARSPAELASLKRDLAAARREAKSLELGFASALRVARAKLTPEQESGLALEIARSDLTELVRTHDMAHRQAIVAALVNWWEKYAVTLKTIHSDRDGVSSKLNAFLEKLGYE
jgi:type I restriction enzyme M protein